MKQALYVRLLLTAGALMCVAMMIVAASLTTMRAGAQEITTIATRNPSATTTNTVTVLVLDMSGSMAQNDPDGLRCSAANAYIDLSGPGNFIGVIGLDNNSGARGGPHNFQQAQIWAQPPAEMATLSERQQLQQLITTKSNHCRPDSTTPTYDALDQALQMLNSATDGGKVPGSVVLLTDGVPSPDTVPQINAIQSDLLPQFRQHNWPIDTVALGKDGQVPGTQATFHAFLGGLSDATTGTFYDDGHGVVPGISPLNIADFFVNIFAQRNHRIVNNDIPPTTLNGGTTRRNFSVTDYTNSLDIVVVKDQAASKASLITPDGHVINQSGSGVFISSFDPHYEIFSVDQPQSGQWELDVTGSGQFLMDSLKKSGIGLSPVSVSQANLATSSALALGQPLTISANLTYNGQPITDNRFTLSGTITYEGAAGQYRQPFALDDKSVPGTYVGRVTAPSTAPPGSYKIVVNASAVSMEAVVASQSRLIRIELFPVPVLNASQGTAIQWDPVLHALYSLSFWPMPQLSSWALNAIPTQGDADIAGEVQLQQQPYANATVSATAHSTASGNSIPVTVINDGGGHFHVLFAPTTSDTYTLTFKTSGSFHDSHGDFGTTQTRVGVTIVQATVGQEIRAWLLTMAYLLCLFFLLLLVRYGFMPHPRGGWKLYQEGEMIGSYEFQRALRNPLQALLQSDQLLSRQARMPAGLRFRFQHGGGIEVHAEGREGDNWQGGDGSPLSQTFRAVSELRHRSKGATSNEHEDDEYEAGGSQQNTKTSRSLDIDETSIYIISGRMEKAKGDNDGDDYEEEESRHRRSTSERHRDDAYDDYSTSSRNRGSKKKQKKSVDMWDEDYD